MFLAGWENFLASLVPGVLQTNDDGRIERPVDIVQKEFEILAGMTYDKTLLTVMVPTKAREHLTILHRHYGVLSPIGNLPEEVLEQIFYFLPVMESELSWTACKSLTDVTHVSRRWRSASISSPRLWTNLEPISLSTIVDPYVVGKQEQRIRLQLERCRSHPISFSFKSPSLDMAPSQRLIRAAICLLSLLVRHCRQWQNVRLDISRPFFQTLSSLRGNIPLLRTLDLTFFTQNLDTEDFPHFADAPSLRFFTLNNSSPLVINVIIPWSQIKEYTNKRETEDGFRTVLATATAISSLNCTLYPLGQTFSTRLHHDSLTKLHLVFKTTLTTILPHLFLPSLTDLSVESCRVTPTLEDVLALITNSSCSLRSLRLIRCASGGDGDWILSKILSLNEELEELYLSRIDAAVLDQMSSPSVILVPNLRKLTMDTFKLHDQFPTPLSLTTFNKMAEARDALHRKGVAARLEILLNVSIYYSDLSPSWGILRALEFPSPVSTDIRFANIRRWVAVLQEHIGGIGVAEPELAQRHEEMAHYAATKWSIVLGHLVLHGVLKEMEEYDTETSSLKLLYCSLIPALLEWVASMKPLEVLPGELQHQISKRIDNLLGKWKALLLADPRAHRRWEFRHNGFMGRIDYIHSDDETRMARMLDLNWDVTCCSTTR